jgi:hypothetical protein
MLCQMFRFKSETSLEAQDETLAKIRTWEEVTSAGRVYPDAKDSDTRRSCFAYLRDDANLEAIQERLSSLNELAEVFTPAERYLR